MTRDGPLGFEEERATLAAAIGPWVTGGIHHLGSTAVPGLDAKPIIDILVGVSDLEGSTAYFEREELVFRDHLRTHPRAAEEYASLKHSLTDRFRNDREAYTDAKQEFIQAVVHRDA
ncbi:MAG TPA: GrpB family protein [Solirubrobacterales bacterium]|nr:GrpB family protein [Solirubrobacterales bacterium]